MRTFLFNFSGDTRMGAGTINSRIGLSEEAYLFDSNTNLFEVVKSEGADINIDCVMIDESQFLTKQQVLQVSDICDSLGIPVMAFGLRTDFLGELFEGSAALLANADKLIEIKGVCYCGRKTTHVLRKDSHGTVSTEGEKISIGGEESYISVCRKHHKEAINNARERQRQ